MDPHDQEIHNALTEDGWSLSHHCVDPGSYREPSKWAVTVQRSGRALTTEYTMGFAYRHWTKDVFRFENPWTPMDQRVLGERPRKGTRSPSPYGRITLHHDRILREYTEPDPPELPDVLYCLLTAAEGVRHGQTFEEWCSEFGYDTDSRKAEQEYNVCRDQWMGLIRLEADFDILSHLFKDY